ncbi:MAG: ABC transporter ATP-binding protein [Hasllibacter sp.]
MRAGARDAPPILPGEIRLRNLVKSFPAGNHRKIVAKGITTTLPPRRSVAILGRNGAGKSTLLQMIAGSVRPDAGSIEIGGTISWPVGYSGSFHPDLSAAQNVRFVARIYGVDTEELEDFVRDFAELGGHWWMPLRTFSSGMRARLAFGCSLGIGFDRYLVDEATATGDAAFRAKSRAVFLDRMRGAGAVVVTHSMKEVREYCTSALVLHNGHLTHYADIEEGIAVHQRLMGVGPGAKAPARGGT